MRPLPRKLRIPILFYVLIGFCALCPIVFILFWQHTGSLGTPTSLFIAYLFIGLSVKWIPGVLFDRLPSVSEQKQFLGGTRGILKNFSPLKSSDYLNFIEQEVKDEIKEPDGVMYNAGGETGRNSSFENTVGFGLSNEDMISSSRKGVGAQVQDHNATSSQTGVMVQKRCSGIRPVLDENIRYMEDQVLTARAYLHFAQPTGNSHIAKELRLRIKDIERVLSQAKSDSDLHRSALQKMKAMESTLYKAKKAYPDCSAFASKLRATSLAKEAQVRAEKKQVSYLIQLVARTFPKGLHCLSMRLTTEYFALTAEKRELPNRQKFQKNDLYHYSIFSDNILACAVVVNSTISNSLEPDKIVIHVVTDPLHFPAMMMWFLMNPPGEAAIQIQHMDEFEWLPSGYNSMFRKGRVNPSCTSPLYHLRFYLPEIFPFLNKVLLLDHDVVVQKDLTGLWSIDMKGKVVGAVQVCNDDISRGLETHVNFSSNECVWAFGMNMVNLQAWRCKRLHLFYDEWLQLAKEKQLCKARSLPLGQLMLYNHTFGLDPEWHLHGLGQDQTIRMVDIEKAAVIHYSGIMKPWFEFSLANYRGYWNKFLKYEHPYLQQCNIHP
ncbi:hypothetical protein HPP92_020969 [Vanilla planifolia]|uniref:Hexosyltransferase n=1 Tax=Vanilla planifolia TaxID=51239 RepID=A0A835Q0N8_VANPL|nr:hypothetical protein HPP92_020969 [Vanilla planifolia]